MTQKDKDKQPSKVNFEDPSSVFENNLKIYNQYVDSFKNFESNQNPFAEFSTNTKPNTNFTINDLSNLIAPIIANVIRCLAFLL